MKKIIAIGLLILLVSTMFCTNAMASGKDENYHGEEGDQPGIGYSVDNGNENDEGSQQADRTRNKDN